MTSEHRGETARGRQRPGLVLLCLIASALLPVLAACSSAVHYSTGAPAPTSSPSSNPYRRFDQDVTKLVERQAEWQAPKRLKAYETARIGLVIGDPSRLKTEIRGLVPGSYPKHAGRVKVGSTISVQLTTYSGDASVTPSDAIDNSLGEHTALLFTWYVHPKHPDTDQATKDQAKGQAASRVILLPRPGNLLNRDAYVSSFQGIHRCQQ
jgi:hypothetical protein